MQCIWLLSDSGFKMKIDICITIPVCLVAKLFYLPAWIIQPLFINYVLSIPLDYQYFGF